MSSRGETALIVLGAGLLATAGGLVGLEAVRLSSSVQVAGRVASLNCAGADNCAPVVEYTMLDGERYHLQGAGVGFAGTFEAGDEWIPIVYLRGDPGSARFRDAESTESILAVLAALLGSVLLGLGWTGRVTLPSGENPRGVTWRRGVAAVVGLASCIGAYVVGWHDVEGSTTVAFAFVTAAYVIPALVRLGQRAYLQVRWLTLCAYGLVTLALVMWLGLLALPDAWLPGLMACAPFAIAVTIPLQARVWPAVEVALQERRMRADRRARLRRAIEDGDRAGDMIVRIETFEAEDRTAEVVRRGPSGDTSLRATWSAFPGVMMQDGTWYLLVEPRVEKRPKRDGGAYRELEHEDWIASCVQCEALGTDLERALRVEPREPMRAWLYPVPLLVCLGGALLGGWAFVDRTPPMSGEPIPATGLVEGLDVAVSRTGRVEEVTAWPGLAVDDPCRVLVEPTHRSSQTCSIEIHCGGGTDVYPAGSGGYTRCLTSASGELVAEDTSMDDGDPAMRIDTRTGKVLVRARGGVNDWSVTIALAPP